MLYRLVATYSLGVLAVLMLTAPAVAQSASELEKVETQGYKVEFSSSIKGVAGQVITVDVAIEPAGNVNYAALYYRRGAERVYKPVVMRKSGRTFSGEIPEVDSVEGEIKYYVRVTDKRGDNLYLVGNQRPPRVIMVEAPRQQAKQVVEIPDFDLSSLDSLESEFQLFAAEDVIVSASKRAQKLSEAPSAVYVISAADIKAQGFTTLADLLRYAPGMDVYRVNDGNAIVGVRGFADEANNLVLVLIDGRQVNVELFGSSFLDNLPITLGEIERVEIVRGPNSTLYGANAFSGIVNIISKDPLKSKQVGHGFVAYDALTRTGIGEAYASGVSHSVGYRVSARYRQAGAYSDPATLATQQYAVRAIGTTEVLGRLVFDLGFSAQKSEQYTVIGEAPTDMDQTHARVEWNYKDLTLLGSWNYWRGRLFAADQFFAALIPEFEINTHTFDFEPRWSHFWDPIDQLTVGANVRVNTFRSDAVATPVTTETRAGLFIQNELSPIAALNINVGARSDFSTFYLPNDTLFNRLTLSPRASVVYSVAEGHALRINAGQAFRKPSYFEQQVEFVALRSVAANFSNLDLLNEKILSVEGGYAFDKVDGLRIQLDGFYYRLRDLVEYDAGQGSYQNLGNADQMGGEVAMRYRINEKWTTFANYAFVSTTDLEKNPLADPGGDPCDVGTVAQAGTSDPAICKRTSRRNPTHRANVGASWISGNWSASANLGFVDQRVYGFIDPRHGGLIFPTRENQALSRYVTSSARAGYQIAGGPVMIGLIGEQLQFDDHREFPGLDAIDVQTGPGLMERTGNYGGEPLGGKLFAFVEATF